MRNRVTPLGAIVAHPARGLVYGNRGCLHDDAGTIRRSHRGRRWIACQLSFRGWRRSPLLRPGGFTELFFLDEATAFAAGHRPCALCRRADYERLVDRWQRLHPGERGAEAIDARLHRERLTGAGQQRHHRAPLDELPDGTMILLGRAPLLVHGELLLPWRPDGYAREAALTRGGGEALVVTPRSLVELLRGGWQGLVPLLHPSAFA